MGACCSRQSSSDSHKSDVKVKQTNYPIEVRTNVSFSQHSEVSCQPPHVPSISKNPTTHTNDTASPYHSASRPIISKKRVNDVLIWLDDDLIQLENFERSRSLLDEAADCIKGDGAVFGDIEECYNFIIKESSNRSFVLIVSGSLGEYFLRRVHNLRSLKSVFVFCADVENHRMWAGKYTKVIDCYDRPDSLFLGLDNWFHQSHLDSSAKQRRCRSKRYIGTSSEYPSLTITFRPGDNNTVIQDVSKDIRKSICYGALINILLRMPRTAERSRCEMDALFKECRDDLPNVPYDYDFSVACQWFVQYRSLRKFIDKLWKKGNLEKLYRCRHFIIDLQEQICKSEPLSKEKRVFYVHSLMLDEVKKLDQNEGKLISINSFLLGSSDRSLALNFVLPPSSKTSNIHSVLFELDIKEQNVYQNGNGVLLPIGLQFKIESVGQSHDGIYIIKLVASGDTDPEWKAVTDDFRVKIGNEASLLMFANMLSIMGEHQEAECFYKICLQETLCPVDVVYNNLGYLYYQQGNFEEALIYNKRALQCRSGTTIDFADLSATYNNLSMVYNALGEQKESRDCHQSALLYQLGTDVKDDQVLAKIYYNGGLLAHEDNHLKSALEHFLQALTSHSKLKLPKYDPDVLQLLIATAATFEKLNLFPAAHDTYDKALAIASNTLSYDNPTIKLIEANFNRVSEAIDREVSHSMTSSITTTTTNHYQRLRPFDFNN